VFTPSLGLIPFVDVALRTRVSDSVAVRSSDRNFVTDSDVTGSISALDQLRLVKVQLQATGPADRLIDNIQISSVPPLPQERLVALIGGNSLAGLSEGNAGAALATVLGQSLLSPLVSSLTDAFGQRFSFALYPTYVPPLISNASNNGGSGSRISNNASSSNSSRRIPSTLVLGAEIGLDITERFNASVLAAPNRSDIPPQLVLRYQLNNTIGVQGSVDELGRVRTQLQLFFRF
ncbi:MAG: translocation/assembly module TamB domain-containing protein, partial [Prochlorococcaceae cyanobacterium]